MRNVLLLISLFGFHVTVFSDEPLQLKIDCSDVTINYEDDPELTNEERLAAMEHAFLESVNRFDLCNLSSAGGNQVGGESGESTQDLAGGAVADTMLQGTEAEAGEESGESTQDLAGDAVADTMLQGTEAEAEDRNAQSTTSAMEERDERVATTGKIVRSGVQKDNGKTPEDIPSADNDDAVAEQIRLAATIEKNADKRSKLWDEYRRYQGLPIKEDEK